MAEPKKYEGDEKVVIGIDVGTTHSAVSYAYLYPSSIPEVKMVTRWPGQPDSTGDSKIPTIVAYLNGTAIACGEEAREYIGDEKHEIARWFKLHLHPDSMKISHRPPAYGDTSNTLPLMDIPPLPKGVTLEQVFFESNTPNGTEIWKRLADRNIIVFTTPNGWDTTQHFFIQEVAVDAKLISREHVEERLEFVTEGEASVHYALAKTHRQTWLKPDSLFAVVDAGGSTVDSTLYECKGLSPRLVLEEVHASECVQAGGVFIDYAMERLLKEKLKGSKFCDDQVIADIVNGFEKKTKRIFDGSQESNHIEFGGRRDTDREYDILQGRITLRKGDVADTFSDVIEGTVDSCLRLLRGHKIHHLLLVGGFGESPYLQARLRSIFDKQHTDVVTVNEPSKKAAAEGATIWYIEQLVTIRAARFTIGCHTCPVYDDTNPEHRARKSRIYQCPDGYVRVKGQFKTVILKDSLMSNGFEEVSWRYHSYKEKPTNPGRYKDYLYAWDSDAMTNWTTDPNGKLLPKMRRICVLQADLSDLWSSLSIREGLNGSQHWLLEYQIKIMFGGTKLRARIQWKERDKLREGPVSILHESVV